MIFSIPWLYNNDPFPSVESALDSGCGASGLLAASDTLDVQRLLAAYHQGIFPWYSDGQPVLWWSPDPRMVLVPAEFKISTSFKKTLKRVLREPAWEIRVDTCFIDIITACAHITRQAQSGTWITPDVLAAYSALHQQGFAHSVETWYENKCVGGLYGMSVGMMFFGESMFALRPDASKIALAALVSHLKRHHVNMLDCQQNTPHLASLGGREIPRHLFMTHLSQAVAAPPIPWQFDKTALLDVMT